MKKMKKILLAVFLCLSFLPFQSFAQAPDVPENYPSLCGLWTFDNTAQILDADVGNDLVLHGEHQSIAGPEAGNLAVNIGSGDYYTCYHDIDGNGGGSEVNEYSMLIDFRVPEIGQWYCFYQANEGNNNDGELFVNASGNIGRTTNGPGYSSYQLHAGEWYRMLVSCDLGNHYNVYLDGVLILAGGSLSVDGEFSLYPADDENLFHFFLDDNGEDNSIDVALAALFDESLDAASASELGGYGHDIQPVLTGILPYLQTPTSNSIYVSWHSDNTGSTTVEYGTTPSLGLSQSGSVEDIGGKNWHTVKLSSLDPDTEYYYKCISESEESDVHVFRTQSDGMTENGHLRLLMLGDSRTDEAKTTEIAYAAKTKIEELYGADIQNQIDAVIHVGDIVTSGYSINQYEEEYFTPYACLSANLPFMVTIGNHESEAGYYYDYMKYEDFSDYGSLLNEKFYSFYLSTVQFLMLNSNTSLQNSIQTNWIEEKLEQSNASSSTQMSFTFLHHPGHSEIWPDGNNSYVQDEVIPLLQQYPKSQMLAYGHSHNYERGVIESQSAANAGDFYIMLTGGAGAALDRWGMYPNQTNYPELMISLDHYVFTITDIDLNAQTIDYYVYSLGHSDKPLDCVLVDHFHRKLQQAAPETPHGLSPLTESGTQALLVASPMEGADSLMTSHFQLTAAPGDYSSPVAESKRDWVDIYGDSGAPEYNPINLNEGIDLNRWQCNTELNTDQTYAWRVRYRDHNLKWSDWSEEESFTVSSDLSAYTDFIADETEGSAPLTVHFTDLSYPLATSWEWDFEDDAVIDSYEQDPEFVYSQEGIYSVSLTTEHGTTTKDFYINTDVSKIEEINNDSNDMVRLHPNPAYNETNIEFVLKQAAQVQVSVINIEGKLVKYIKDANLQAGKHCLSWDLTNANNQQVSPGKYFIKVKTGDRVNVKAVIVINK